LRIAHVIGFYTPGLGYEENCLPFEQAKRGHDVCIFTSRRSALRNVFGWLSDTGQSQSPQKNPTDHDDAVEIIRLSSTPPLYGQVLLRGLRPALRKFEPDVVHSHGGLSPHSMQCVLHAKSLGYSLFIDDHSHELNLHAETGVRAAYVGLVAALYRAFGNRVKAFLPVTPSAANILRERLGIPPHKLVVIGLGADDQLFAPSGEQRRARRQELGLRDKDIAIVSTGKLTPAKEVGILVEAVSMIKNSLNPIRLILAGHIAESYRVELTRLADRLGVGEGLVFLPFVPHAELPSFYNAADVGVWPGAHTITALEALSTGLPCALPLCDNAYEAIRDWKAALGFTRGDPKSLADAITTLVHDSDLRSKMSKSARELVESKLSWKVICEHTLQVYRGGVPARNEVG